MTTPFKIYSLKTKDYVSLTKRHVDNFLNVQKLQNTLLTNLLIPICEVAKKVATFRGNINIAELEELDEEDLEIVDEIIYLCWTEYCRGNSYDEGISFPIWYLYDWEKALLNEVALLEERERLVQQKKEQEKLDKENRDRCDFERLKLKFEGK